MAKEIITRLLDDLDGTEASTSVEFSWNGVAYEIDLSKKNARELENALAPFVRAARRSGSKSTVAARGTRTRGRAKRSGAAHDLGEIRAWASANGHKVAERGRIPAAILEAFSAAKGAVAEVLPSAPAAAKAAPSKSAARKAAPRKAAARKASPRKAAAKKAATKAPAKKAATRGRRAAAAPVEPVTTV